MDTAAVEVELSFGVPWFASDAVTWLDANMVGTDRVLEFGGGRSTVYLLGRCQAVTTSETSPQWTRVLLDYLAKRPNLYRRWSLRHVPVDWAPNWTHREKGYWGECDVSLSWADARALEKRYLDEALEIGDHNVVLIDGGLRSHLYVLYAERNLYEQFEIIIIDNTEHSFPAQYFAGLKLEGFTRFDFVAGSFDNKLPADKDGFQVTTIYVRQDRLPRVVEVETEHPSRWDEGDLVAHQLFEPGPEAAEKARHWEQRIRQELIDYELLPASS